MTKLELILEQADALSQAEREQLLQMLSARVFSQGAGDDDSAAGQRGLALWTESTRGEDWSMYYPDSLRNGGWAGS